MCVMVACVRTYLSSYIDCLVGIGSSCRHVDIEAMLPTGDRCSLLHREYSLQLLLHWGWGAIYGRHSPCWSTTLNHPAAPCLIQLFQGDSKTIACLLLGLNHRTDSNFEISSPSPALEERNVPRPLPSLEIWFFAKVVDNCTILVWSKIDLRS